MAARPGPAPDCDRRRPRNSAGRSPLVLLLLGRLRLPLPLLLHAHRLPAEDARHLDRRGVPRSGQPDAAQLRADQLGDLPGAVAGELRDLHRRRDAVHHRLRAAGRLRPGPAALPRPRQHLRSAAARAGRPVPAADDPALRADRAQLRPRRLLPRDDPAVRHQHQRGLHLPAVLPATAAATCSTPRGSTGRASSGSCCGSPSRCATGARSR